MIGLEFLINIYGFKNKDIANRLNISPVTVHDWLTGKRKIPPIRLKQLSDIFNICEEIIQADLNKRSQIIILENMLNNLKNEPE